VAGTPPIWTTGTAGSEPDCVAESLTSAVAGIPNPKPYIEIVSPGRAGEYG
jgi:hypothetical protein